MVGIVGIKSGFHANAAHLQKDSVEDFSVVDLGQKIKEKAPTLWSIITVLGDTLEEKAAARKKRKSTKRKGKKSAQPTASKCTSEHNKGSDLSASGSSSDYQLSDEYNSQ